MSLLQNSVSAVNFCDLRKAGWRGSGQRRPEARDAEYLIDRERDQAEHEVAFDLDGAAHADEPRAEFILQPGVDSFGHGSKIKNYVVGVGHVDEFHALDFPGPFGLGFMLGAEVAIDDRHMAERLSAVMNGGGVVGRIHEIVEIGDAGAGHESDLTEAEWSEVGPLIPPAKRGGNRRTVDIRQVTNGVMYILSTGCQWRAIPKDLPPRSTVHEYLVRWTHDGTLE